MTMSEEQNKSAADPATNPASDKKKNHFFGRKKCDDCEKLKAEAAEYKAGWQRALADYQNLKKETEKNREDLSVWCQWNILEGLIPVYDNFKKAFRAPMDESKESDKAWVNWKKGIEFIMKQMSDFLNEQGVKEMVTVGEKFDPAKHEAVGEEDGEEDVILKEVEGGYQIGEKVARPAKVVVGKTKQNQV